jgi:competence protein ComEC
MQSLHIFNSNMQRFYFLITCLVIFFFQIFFYFQEYKVFIKNEVFPIEAKVINIYEKQFFKTLKIQNEQLTFFTSVPLDFNVDQLQKIHGFITTSNISFYQYLKGFYTKNIALQIEPNKQLGLKNMIISHLDESHNNPQISKIYQALYLAVPFDHDLRLVFSKFGISHLVALSGFHLSIIFTLLYFILNILYKNIHNNHLPYRNKKFDIIITSSILLYLYMIFVDIPPSLLRSFVMFIFGFYFLRYNIKIVSFETLMIVGIVIITLFPKLLFSLSFWFSMIGVFYIFLYLQYFSKLNKYLSLLLFNFWIFMAFTPVVHYFFDITSAVQLFSPIITLIFTIFYPISVLLHMINYSSLLDPVLNWMINFDVDTYSVITPLWFFVVYVMTSLMAIFSKYGFWVLNILSFAYLGVILV